ncbi:MAG: RNA polymerase sigma factor [Steroidobacteraceae bacterium]
MNKDKDDGRDATPLTGAFIACRNSLARYVATFFVGREDIEDTVQETYLRTLMAEENTEIQSPKAFLFRVARNIALNRKKKQRKKFEEAVGNVDELITVDDAPSPLDKFYS